MDGHESSSNNTWSHSSLQWRDGTHRTNGTKGALRGAADLVVRISDWVVAFSFSTWQQVGPRRQAGMPDDEQAVTLQATPVLRTARRSTRLELWSHVTWSPFKV